MAGSLPTLSKTWTVTPNVSVSSFPIMLFQIKTTLVSLGWHVDGSSNSTTAGMDNVDRWISSSNVVLGGSVSSARSWIVLRNPAGRQLLLDYWGLASPDCQAQGSSGALFTGGTISAAPTATDAFPSTAASANYRPLGEIGVAFGGSARKLSFIQSTDGKNLIMLIGLGGKTAGMWCVGDVMDPHPYYPSPFVFLMFTGAPGIAYNDPINGWSAGGFVNVRFAGRGPTGPVDLRSEAEYYWVASATPIWLFGSSLAVKNDLSLLFPHYDPLTLTSTSDSPGRFGVWPDLFPTVYATAGWAQGDILPASGSPRLLHVEDILVPWPTATAIQLS